MAASQKQDSKRFDSVVAVVRAVACNDADVVSIIEAITKDWVKHSSDKKIYPVATVKKKPAKNAVEVFTVADVVRSSRQAKKVEKPKARSSTSGTKKAKEIQRKVFEVDDECIFVSKKT